MYWTCFGFANFPPNKLHCTHKFLGELTEVQANQIKGLLSTYFSKVQPWTPFKAKFNKEELFGHEKNVHVLITDLQKKAFYPSLRVLLDRFNQDDFPEYQPHITCPENWKVWDQELVKYCFMKGDQVIQCWK